MRLSPSRCLVCSVAFTAAQFVRVLHLLLGLSPNFCLLILAILISAWQPESSADEIGLEPRIELAFSSEIRSLLENYCYKCHSGSKTEGEIDLALFKSLGDVRKLPDAWQKVGEMLDSRQMPPKDARQPSDAEFARLQNWVHEYLAAEAKALAGDPGRVVLRRLSNAEYKYTIQDLTGVHSLDPAREFPTDSAAGEGFTNTGSALVMSPALVAKFLDAAKEVANHAVLLPDGIRFSPHASRRDWTDELLGEIRDFYRQFTEETGRQQLTPDQTGLAVNQGGRLPLLLYLSALHAEREALLARAKSISELARERKLSAKYLGLLWNSLTSESTNSPSLLLDHARSRWRTLGPQEAQDFVSEIATWQSSLWRFFNVGHLGKVDGPKAWMEPNNPITPRQEFKLKLPAPSDGEDVVIYLCAGDAGDGNRNDDVIWERPRLIVSGRPDLLLRDIRPLMARLTGLRSRIFSNVENCLSAAAVAQTNSGQLDIDELARNHQVDSDVLAAWLDFLGIGTGDQVPLGALLTKKSESSSGYDFIKRWTSDNSLSVVANSSDQHVRIPGNMKPHSVAVHPAPTVSVGIGWRSPLGTTIRISGSIQDAHTDCGNGVEWFLELRRGSTRLRLTAGSSQGSQESSFGPLDHVAVQPGDVIALVVSPREGNHGCDLTALDLTIQDDVHQWNLAREISPNILAGNPHADSHGHPDVWHFFSEPVQGVGPNVIPAGSLLARWQVADGSGAKRKLAEQLQQLLNSDLTQLPKDSPDFILRQQLTSLRGPLLSAARRSIAKSPAAGAEADSSQYGLDSSQFGTHPNAAAAVDNAHVCVRAPSILEIRLPAELAAGAEFVTVGTLHAETGKEGSVDLQLTLAKPERKFLLPALPVVALDGSASRSRIETAFAEFRQVFPPALCYSKIVPVDEVVTLFLYYREDHLLQRLLLEEDEIARLDRLWDELYYVSREPLLLVDAFLQKYEYASQLGDPKVFEPLRQPINDRAAAFRQQLIETEPRHLQGVLDFANRAYRRPLTADEAEQLRALYRTLRHKTIQHEDAIRFTLASVLVSPAFLYRTERPPPGIKPGPVTNWELANRLSYFLWSSQPDSELRETAASGQLTNSEVLIAQTKRMLRDPKTRRLATEFGCQWLHIHGFDSLDEKSERHFPTFVNLRGAMYEESIQFFADLFQNDRSVLSILDADHTFLNQELASHYGIPGVTGDEWRRVEDVKRYGRGGVLTQAATLAKQSGASRTSPILRGAWLSEVLLGEKLPRPPNNVPPLAESPPEGLTERQLIERHSQDPACAKCHVRIDPYGYALENYDGIGRYRTKDHNRLTIDARTTLPDGTAVDGVGTLRNYLLSTRRDSFIRQFNRKLLGYALGRSVQLSDEKLLGEMRDALVNNDYRIGSVVEQIVRSPQFREIRGREFDLKE